MNPFLSYARHLITFWVTSWAIEYAIPTVGLSEALGWLFDSIALFVIWAIAKYIIPEVKKKIKF